ncbi:MAG TPA: hybrid sensor histidine kinase/response regulator, partial [Porphyromonadaceae bacterium]|nr:hybrid sensor histidine kinase/response regulator [Porphyromonadaceae bacterium]
TLIISDIIMPELDGVELVKKLKSQEQTAHIPIILLSSKNSIENQIEGIEVGADAYINKPFHPRHLMALIENMLRRMKTILDYADSPYVAMESFEGKIIHKEDYELMLHVTKIIADNIDNDELSVEFIAREIAISKMQLYRKIKEITDRTPMEYIRSVRLKHVEKLLITTNKTISEIMYMSGFNNKAYFHREFLKKYKITPKEYRLKNQERP